MADHALKTRGWTNVSAQNQHLDVYGVLETPMLYKLGQYTQNEAVKRLAICMYRVCGQMIDPFGSQGEQLQQTNFAQHGDMSNVTSGLNHKFVTIRIMQSSSFVKPFKFPF